MSSERIVYNGTPSSRGRLPIYTFVGTGLVFACAIGVGVWKLSSPETASSTTKHPTTVETGSVSSNDKTNDVEAAGSQGSNGGGTSNSGQGNKNSGNTQSNGYTQSGNQSGNGVTSGDKNNRGSSGNSSTGNDSNGNSSQGNDSQSHEQSNANTQWDEDPILPPGTKRGETHLGALGIPRDNGNTAMGQHSGTSDASESTDDSDNAPGIGLWFTKTPESLQRVLSSSQLHQAREIIDDSVAQAQSEAVPMHRNKDGVWVADDNDEKSTPSRGTPNPSEPHSVHPSSGAKPTDSADSPGSSQAPTPSEPSAQPLQEPTPTDTQNATNSRGGAAQPTTTHPSAIPAPSGQGNQGGAPTQEPTATIPHTTAATGANSADDGSSE